MGRPPSSRSASTTTTITAPRLHVHSHRRWRDPAPATTHQANGGEAAAAHDDDERRRRQQQQRSPEKNRNTISASGGRGGAPRRQHQHRQQQRKEQHQHQHHQPKHPSSIASFDSTTGLRRRYALVGTFLAASVVSVALTSIQAGGYGRVGGGGGVYGYGDSVLDAAWQQYGGGAGNGEGAAAAGGAVRGGARPGGLAGAADLALKADADFSGGVASSSSSLYSEQQLRLRPVAPNLAAAVTIERQRTSFPPANSVNNNVPPPPQQQEVQQQQQPSPLPEEIPLPHEEEADPGVGVDCTIQRARKPDHPITPTYTASYPGSGAKMTWNLIEALTGLRTGDDHGLNGLDIRREVVSVKTHHPHPEGSDSIPGRNVVPRAVLLLRNPLDAVLSYFNYLYERSNGLPGHSTRAPRGEWEAWRDTNFDGQLQLWSDHVLFWMDRYLLPAEDAPNERMMVLQYERLTDGANAWGRAEALRLAEFLGAAEGVTVRNAEEVPCVWGRVVKYKGGGGRRWRRRLQQHQVQQTQQAQKSVGADAGQRQRSTRQLQRQQQQDQRRQQGQPNQRPPPLSDNPVVIRVDPQSKSSGPSYVPPYTAPQLQSVVFALSDLLSRHTVSAEGSLRTALTTYVEDVERRLRELVNSGER